MYSFEEFSEKLIASVRNMLIERYGQAELTMQRKLKNNGPVTAVVCDVYGPGKQGACPTFYPERLYEYYQQGAEIEELCLKLNDQLKEAIADGEDVYKKGLTMVNEPNHIVFQFIHTKQNEELLERLPHREFQDLSIVYGFVSDYNDNGSFKVLINDKMAERIGLNESELYDLAYENTKRIYKPCIVPMQTVATELILHGKNGVDLEAVEIPEDDSILPIYVVSNRYMCNGAINILYTEELHELAEKLDADLYLVPISVDEMIAVSADGPDIEDLLEKLYENNQAMPLADRLSNDIYRYDRKTQSIVQETDSEHKMLEEKSIGDGMNLGMC